MDRLKNVSVRLLLAVLATLSVGTALALTAADADAAPPPPPPTTEEYTLAELEQMAIDINTGKPVPMSEGARAAFARKDVVKAPKPTGGSQVMAVTGWINISASQGSYNCIIQARQNGSNWWQTRVAGGSCWALYVETYAYNHSTMADLDYYIPTNGRPIPVGQILESRSPLKICYIYVYWRDGARVFRDVVFWDGGSQF